jgi:hypothetical protein
MMPRCTLRSPAIGQRPIDIGGGLPNRGLTLAGSRVTSRLMSRTFLLRVRLTASGEPSGLHSRPGTFLSNLIGIPDSHGSVSATPRTSSPDRG